MTSEATERARGFAHAAHFGQNDRDGRPHIEHVARVVEGVEAFTAVLGQTYHEQAQAAWLHDVVEDSSVTFEALGSLFKPVVIKAVRLLTRPEYDGMSGTYMDYVLRIADAGGVEGEIARRVKQADLNDNIRRCEAEGNDRLARRYGHALGIIVNGGTT
jgi:hypothetical protein